MATPMAYGYHFSHSNAHINAISSFTPSSTACPVGVQFLPWKRVGSVLWSSTIYDDLLWNALVVERASKQFDHVHTSHRSTSSVGLAGADGEFPITRAATELMHDLRRNYLLRFPLLCSFFASFISLFILVGLGSQLLGG